MATTLNIDTNFVGEVAGEYIGKIIKEANTISDGLITVLPNLTAPQFVRKIETEAGFVDYACGWQPEGSVTLSEKELTPKKIKWDFELCKEEFRQAWTASQMGFSAHNDSLPQTEQAALLLDAGKRIARKIDVDIWNGDDATGNLSGILPKTVGDADVIKVTGQTIDSVNVEAELNKFLDAITDEMDASDDLVRGVSTNVIRALRKLYGTQARSNGTFLNPNSAEFNGYTLTEIKALPANTMIAYRKSNVFFGTGLLADHNEIRVKDMDESDLSGQVRMKVVLTGGVQYAYGGEIVTYIPA